jgi:CheY-like chemotaxis protein
MAGLQHVPVVYITGYSGEYEEQLQMHEALLVKPFRLAELKDAILNIVASASSLV